MKSDTVRVAQIQNRPAGHQCLLELGSIGILDLGNLQLVQTDTVRHCHRDSKLRCVDRRAQLALNLEKFVARRHHDDGGAEKQAFLHKPSGLTFSYLEIIHDGEAHTQKVRLECRPEMRKGTRIYLILSLFRIRIITFQHADGNLE